MTSPLPIAAVILACAGAAAAELAQFDGVVAPGLLSDADLYRLATCGARPGEDCRVQALRWKKPVLTLAVEPGDDPQPAGFAMPLVRAAAHAVDEINSVDAGIAIRLLPVGPADITIRPTALQEGAQLVESPGFSGAGTMGVGFMTIWAGDDHFITEAVILISTSIKEEDLMSVVLEEITQSLGFQFDVEGPDYEGVSILSQSSNAITTIAGQDAALLRLHYPLPTDGPP